MKNTCAECSTEYEAKTARSRYCTRQCYYRARDRAKQFPCAVCGEPMHGGRSVRPEGEATHQRCKEPRKKGRCTVKGCSATVQGKGLCSTHYAQQWRATKRYALSCKVCGKQFKADRRGRECCSRQCVSNLGADKNRTLAQSRRAPHAQVEIYTGPRHTPTPHVRSTHRLTSGRCRICGDWFVSPHTDVTCSPECNEARQHEQRRLHKAKRRAVKRNAYVADVHRKKVFEADGYRCHICQRMTDKTKQVPHPKAPTIDHIIPLALGGKHEPLNTRTACFACNTKKSHVGYGDQLMLLTV